MKTLSSLFLALFALTLLTGCAAFRVSVKDVDPNDASTLTANYDQKDLISWTDEMTDLILKQFPSAEDKRPILSYFGIQNRTKQHLDTQSLADTISGKLLDSGKIQLTNTARRDELLREQGHAPLHTLAPVVGSHANQGTGAHLGLTGQREHRQLAFGEGRQQRGDLGR